jgi:predicted dehydrogenase
MADPIRFGLVGAGGIARAYVDALAAMSDARLVAVADLRIEAATALAEACGATPFTSHHELIRRSRCDAVIVCTPPRFHAEVTIDLLDAGIAVLCEKPLSISLDAARSMIDCAGRRGVLLSMASKFRYVPAVSAARALVLEGVIGELLEVENAFSGRVDMTRRWNSDPWQSGGGVIIDNGTHSADVVRFLAGPVHSVFAAQGRRMQPSSVEDSAHMILRCQAGILATVDLSWSADRMLDWFVRLHGSEGVIEIGWRESRLRRTGGSWTGFAGGYDKQLAFSRQLSEFCRSLRGDSGLLVSGEEALHAVSVIQAAYLSISRGSWVGIDQIEPVATTSATPVRAAE